MPQILNIQWCKTETRGKYSHLTKFCFKNYLNYELIVIVAYELWQHGDITTKESDGSRNMSSRPQTPREIWINFWSVSKQSDCRTVFCPVRLQCHYNPRSSAFKVCFNWIRSCPTTSSKVFLSVERPHLKASPSSYRKQQQQSIV